MFVVGRHFAFGCDEKGTVEIAIVLFTKKATHHGHAIFACPRFDGSDGLAFHRIRQASHIHREAGGEGLREDSQISSSTHSAKQFAVVAKVLFLIFPNDMGLYHADT